MMEATFARRAALAALLTFAALPAMPTFAQTVVFDNGNPNLSLGAFTSDSGASQFLAEDFAFGATTTFDTVRWFGVYFPGNTPTEPDAFTISFFDTTAGIPNANLRSGEGFVVGSPSRVDTGSDSLGFDLYQYEATLTAPITMVAGAYGIEIVNDTTADTDDDWAWAVSTQTGLSFVRNVPDGEFLVNGGGFAFQLIDSTPVVVPESSTLALVLPPLALIGAVVVRRRK